VEEFITVVVAEDEDLIRNNLIKKIENASPHMKVVGAAENGKAAIDIVSQELPDLVITDIRMPATDGIELIRTLHTHYPRIRKVISSGYADFEYARQAIRYGVTDYLLKPVSADDLGQLLSRIRDAVLSERHAGKLAGHAGSPPEEIVHRVQQYMREHFDQELTLEHIAKHFNFHSSYLSKLFVKYTGELPSKYLMSLRINEAKYLLRNYPNMPVKEVGERVGYPDQFYFSRVFKQMTGSTPKDYQK